MYGHESAPTRVYRYGARTPHEGLDALRTEEREAHRLRNALIAVERDRRAAAEAAILEHAPDVAAALARIAEIDAAIEAEREAIRRRNASERRRRPKDDPAAARIAELRAERRGITGRHDRADPECACLGCRRRAAYRDPAVRQALADVEAEARRRAKALYADRRVSWAQYNAVAQSIPRSGPPPRFVGWGEASQRGRVVVQIQGGATWDELLAGVNGARVQPDGAAPPGPGRRAARPWYVLSLRVGRDARGDDQTAWLAVRFAVHRPIPADARVQQVWLVRRRVGTQDEYSVQFVVARPGGWARADTAEARGACGVDVRWRQQEDGSLVVAHAEGEDGWSETLVIPAERLARLRYAETLHSIRDREFDQVRAVFTRWLAENDAPDWLREETATLAQWRSPARLAALVLRWRGTPAADACPQCGATGDEPCRTARRGRVLAHRHRAREAAVSGDVDAGRRFDGDGEILARLEEWRRQDKHLADWEAAQRRGFVRWRQDLYRRFAARLRWRYETVVVEDTDWRALLSRPPAEDQEEPERLNRRWFARVASPGAIRLAIQQSVEDTRQVDAAYTSQRCSECGADRAADVDPATEREYRCEAGHRMAAWQNAARNLLAAAASGEVVRA